MNRNQLFAASSAAPPLASANSSLLSSSFAAGTGPGEVAGRDDAQASASPAGALFEIPMTMPELKVPLSVREFIQQQGRINAEQLREIQRRHREEVAAMRKQIRFLTRRNAR